MAASDPSSFASPSCCLTRHLHLRCRVDFGAHALRGTAAFTTRAERDALRCLVLDTKDLQIFKVTANGQDAKFAFGEKHSFKGTPLEITLPFEMRRGQEAIIEVSFESSPKSSALQWFTPEQTSGKKHPFLFSQCQANHCRAILPCQDTPAVKLTYYAEISVPKELVALMSAGRDGEMPDPEDSSRKIYRFSQNVSCLTGIFTSNRKIGPRTLVWAEKELVDKSAYEFAETEAMLQTAEDLAGPYVWGQYDLLVLPPSFPYGGMENPCLTFVTPTLLVSVIAHEISHSWTGNLVTNKTWEHFWLNEGHTVYLERRIGGRLFGEQFRHFKALGGWRQLQNTVNILKVLLTLFSCQEGDFLFPRCDPFFIIFDRYDMTLTNACVALSQRWIKATESDLGSFSSADLKGISSHQLIEFLALLLLEAPLPLSHVKRMQQVYDFNATGNSEIRFRWLRLCIQSKWEEAIPLALKMATEQGRMKFTRPLFRDLYNFDKSRDLAVKTFLEHRACMHPVTSMLVGKDLKQDQ
uniref:Leukotriene A4 hydrolase n=1 Tax=Pavo cristatus TaxID=9049 RepID=A0A8C9G3M1_PAVCR